MTSVSQVHTVRASTNIPEDVDELLDLDSFELQRLYENATVPRLDAIRGDLRGRMLAVTVLRSAQPFLNFLARRKHFPWRGKSFRPASIDRGEGINRVFSDRLKLFRFRTFIDRSRAGDFDAVQLDYDLGRNPWVIRRVKDEIRMLRPGLYLGQAYFQTRKKAHLVLYFGLQS